MKTIKRDIFNQLVNYLYEDVALVLIGARQVGKTSVLMYLQEYLEQNGSKCLYFDLEDPKYLELLNEGVDQFLNYLKENGTVLSGDVKKKTYILIDEIQYMQNPSSFIKLIVDHHRELKLVVSGSSSFDIKTKFTDSLVGRILPFEIHPLSFSEFLDFKGSTLNTKEVTTPTAIKELNTLYKEYVLYGGYPRIVLTNELEKKEAFLRQIIDTYVKKDIKDLGGIEDIDKFNKFLALLASLSGKLLNVTSVSKEINLSVNTVNKYLDILEETFILKRIAPFSGNMGVEIRKTPKICFFDSGLATLLWLRKFPGVVTGFNFETAVYSDLVKKVGKENIRYWRTKLNQEIDFVVDMADSITLFEVKTNFNAFQPAAFESFEKKHKVLQKKVVGLEGTKLENLAMYPWEIQNIEFEGRH